MAAKHKRRFEAWLEHEFRSDGMTEPQRLARQVALLIEGAIAQMLIRGDVSYALAAGEAAATLVSGSTGFQHRDRNPEQSGSSATDMYTD